MSVVNTRFIKPLDKAMLLELARTHDGFATVQDNVVASGAGSGVSELLNAEAVVMPMLHQGLPDSYQHNASREDLLAEAGIDATGIHAAILKHWSKLRNTTAPQAERHKQERSNTLHLPMTYPESDASLLALDFL